MGLRRPMLIAFRFRSISRSSSPYLSGPHRSCNSRSTPRPQLPRPCPCVRHCQPRLRIEIAVIIVEHRVLTFNIFLSLSLGGTKQYLPPTHATPLSILLGDAQLRDRFDGRDGQASISGNGQRSSPEIMMYWKIVFLPGNALQQEN